MARPGRQGLDDVQPGGPGTGSRSNPNPDVQALAQLRGPVPNTESRMRSAHVGVGLFEGPGTLGVSISRMESRYGVPIRFDVTGQEEAEAVFLDAAQTRVDIRAGLEFAGSLFEQMTLRGGFADYSHVEGVANTQEEGTLFANQGYELRLELAQRARGNLRGVVGGQLVHRDFLAVGEEAFVPPNISDEWGLFSVQELSLGALLVEAGVRVESRAIRSREADFDRRFTTLSTSLGGVWRIARDWRLVGTLARSARPPAPEELLADGAHVGTQAYEIGDPTLGVERSTAVEVSLRGKGEGWRLEVAAYATRFSGFIYQDETGEVLEGLPVFRFRAAPARTWGLELDAGATLAEFGMIALRADVVADLVRANIVDVGQAPRIPPARVLGGLALEADNWAIRAEAEHSFAQRRVSLLETTTDPFTLVNFSADWQPVDKRPDLRLSLAANNLFDIEARRHASFLKDYAPMAGRDIRLSLRVAL